MSESLKAINKRQLRKLAEFGDPDDVTHMRELYQAEYEKDPFRSKQELKQAVCSKFVQRSNYPARKVEQIFNLVTDILQPNFAEVSTMVQAQIQSLIKEASENLYEPIFSKDGQVGEKFSPAVMSAIVKAHSVISNNAVKTQELLLAASKQAMEHQHHEDRLNLQIADKTELKKALKEGLIDNPDLVKSLIRRREQQKKLESADE